MTIDDIRYLFEQNVAAKDKTKVVANRNGAIDGSYKEIEDAMIETVKQVVFAIAISNAKLFT